MIGLVTVLSLGCNQSPKNDPPAKKETTATKKNDQKKNEKKQNKKQGKKQGKPQIPPPADVAAAPADATKTKSGLAYKSIQKGTGKENPKADAEVEVHYTGWTTDGKMFDSSVQRGKPISFPLQNVIKGWTEGLQLMVVGEKTRFWIPENLAYQGQKGPPAGMLVFEVELLSFKNPPPPPADVAAVPADAKKTKSGLAYKILQKGDEKEKPEATSTVKIHYTGWTTAGIRFASTSNKKRPASIRLGQPNLPGGWQEGIQLMTKGSKIRLWIPESQTTKGKKTPEGMLVFDMELLSFTTPPPPPKTPKDVAAPPKKAKKTKSGLAYKVLKKGTGKENPKPNSRVQVHYTGWTTDGKMFDSSVQRGRPATFGLSGVIKGWTEGLQLMVVGEKTRFWIPVELAYNNQPRKPKGMLVFDVELLEIK